MQCRFGIDGIIRNIESSDLRESLGYISEFQIHSLASYYRFVAESQRPWIYKQLSGKLELLSQKLSHFFSWQKVDPIVFLSFWYYKEGKSIRDISLGLQRDFQIDFPKNSLTHTLVHIFKWELRSNNSHETLLSLQKHAKNGSGRYSIERYNQRRTKQKTAEVNKKVFQCIYAPLQCDLDEVAVLFECSRNLKEKVEVLLTQRYGISEGVSYLSILQSSGMSMGMIAQFLLWVFQNFFHEVGKDTNSLPKITSSEVNKMLLTNKEEH